MKNSKLKFLTSYLLEEKFLFFTGSICTVFRVFLDVYLPTVISSIIDADLVNMENFYSFIVQKALLYLGLNLLIIVLLLFVRTSFNKLSCNIAYKIQSGLIRHKCNILTVLMPEIWFQDLQQILIQLKSYIKLF